MTTSRVFAVFVAAAGRWRALRGGLFGGCLSSAIDILWPVTDIHFRIEKQSLRTVHCLMLVPVRAHEIRIALIGIGIDSVWAKIGRSFALDISRMFTPVRFFREEKSVGTPLIFIPMAVRTLVESITRTFDTVESVFARSFGWRLRWRTSRTIKRETLFQACKVSATAILAVFVAATC